ncbi:myb/SANT-like DNA-binding domain-containing protein 1 [Pimephales promelas]|uniref:myb/SANT-like DNA-binding domain-containing protein 1 n=1 Tax=Pimephales promelas TaxID=90988 RepID=UPI001955F306|nr:myb/SANT-like DNA-binding domain-containing protein 1 [Pimephales promelas]KAG1959373.1 myb/SANT-like DNA-binding domain-containing protein [Pimephales promelas]
MASEDLCFSYTVPGSSEKHRRARNWTDSEMKALVYIWEEYVAELKKAKRNAKIYETMAKQLYDLTGEQRHREEIKMKITNMTFQYRKLKYTANGGNAIPDWPYYKSIERILSKVPEHAHMSPPSLSTSGPSTSQIESSVPPSAPPSGFLPEYTGSSEERDINDEDEVLTDNSGSSFETRSQPRKRRRLSSVSLRRKKLRVMDAMLQEQRRISHAVEEACHEVRRVMHQQNFLQVQSLQLQERMMNLLEKMIPAQPAPSWPIPPVPKSLGTHTPE